MFNLKNLKSKGPILKLAGLAASVLFVCLTLACSQATESAPDVGATVNAAVAATVNAQSEAPPSAPTQANLGQAAPTPAPTAATVPTSMPTATPVPTHTLASKPTATPTPTPLPTPTSTPTPTPDPTLMAYVVSLMPYPTQTPAPLATLVPAATPTRNATSTLTPRPTATPTPTPVPFDIKEANCQHEDLAAEMPFHDFSLAESEGPYTWEPWEIRQWYGTDWWTDDGYRIRCRTNIFDSVEAARWSLNYSTALQRVWGQEGLLEHRQVFAPVSGDDTLAIEIEVGRRFTVAGREATTHVYVAKSAMFRRGNIVVILEYGSTLKEVCPNNPILCSYAPDAFFTRSWQPVTDIASRVDERLLAELARVNR